MPTTTNCGQNEVAQHSLNSVLISYRVSRSVNKASPIKKQAKNLSFFKCIAIIVFPSSNKKRSPSRLSLADEN